MKSEIEFASHPGNLALVRDFVRQFLKPLSFSETEKDLIVLGLDEACTNVIRYAYHHEPNELICLVCELLDEGVRFRIRDSARNAPRKKCTAARSTSSSPAASASTSSAARSAKWITI